MLCERESSDGSYRAAQFPRIRANVSQQRLRRWYSFRFFFVSFRLSRLNTRPRDTANTVGACKTPGSPSSRFKFSGIIRRGGFTPAAADILSRDLASNVDFSRRVTYLMYVERRGIDVAERGLCQSIHVVYGLNM